MSVMQAGFKKIAIHSNIQEEDRYPIRTVFQIGWADFKAAHPHLRPEQLKAGDCISLCRTKSMGINYYQCTSCDGTVSVPCSCHNRNCPNCQALDNYAFIEENKGCSIDAPYFHIVFTVPAELYGLFLLNQDCMYSLLHRTASETVIELARDPKYLGTVPGIIQILHTWGSKLNYHPHIHALVCAAGLSADRLSIIKCRHEDYFIPMKVISRKFRGKFLDAVKKFFKAGTLTLPRGLSSYSYRQKLFNKLFGSEWVVYQKATFQARDKALEYLGRYANRIAISNARIISHDNQSVTFSYKDYKDNGKIRQETVTIQKFIRLFIQHVPPKGFQKVRYYGFLSNSQRRKNLKRLNDLQGFQLYKERFNRKSAPADIIAAVYGHSDIRCPFCGKGILKFQMSSRELNQLEHQPDMSSEAIARMLC